MRAAARTSAATLVLSLAAAALLAPRTGALADEKAPKEGAPGAGDKNGGDKNGGDKKKDPAEQIARTERAKRLVRELESTIAILKAAKTADAETIAALEKALEDARRLAQPITAAELTEDERKRLAEEMRKAGDDPAPKDGGGAPGAPGSDEWRQRQLANAFKDADLTETEQDAATKILNDWWPKWGAAWGARDSKQMSDLKRERDESLEKALGKKKAQKVINNLNAMGPGRR